MPRLWSWGLLQSCSSYARSMPAARWGRTDVDYHAAPAASEERQAEQVLEHQKVMVQRRKEGTSAKTHR